MRQAENRRIPLIEDSAAMREDFREILGRSGGSSSVLKWPAQEADRTETRDAGRSAADKGDGAAAIPAKLEAGTR